MTFYLKDSSSTTTIFSHFSDSIRLLRRKNISTFEVISESARENLFEYKKLRRRKEWKNPDKISYNLFHYKQECGHIQKTNIHLKKYLPKGGKKKHERHETQTYEREKQIPQI